MIEILKVLYNILFFLTMIMFVIYLIYLGGVVLLVIENEINHKTEYLREAKKWIKNLDGLWKIFFCLALIKIFFETILSIVLQSQINLGQWRSIILCLVPTFGWNFFANKIKDKI